MSVIFQLFCMFQNFHNKILKNKNPNDNLDEDTKGTKE